jgi:hypothetical protein
MSWRGGEARDGRIEPDGLRVGDRVWYRNLNDAVIETTVIGLVHSRGAELIGFHAEPTNDSDPKVAIPLERVVKARRGSARS